MSAPSLERVPRLVVDVNAILNGVTGRPDSILRRLYLRFRGGEVRFVASAALLEELGRVVGYPKVQALGVTPPIAFAVAADLLLLGEYVERVPEYDWPSLSDRYDWYLLDLLFESAADALVTQDAAVLEAAKALGMPALHPKELKPRASSERRPNPTHCRAALS